MVYLSGSWSTWASLADLEVDSFDGDSWDLIDAISIPVLMIAQAVGNMAQVKGVADKIDEERRKAPALAFITVVLFLIPVAGEIAGAVTGIGDIAAISALIGAAGNAAMDIYTIVDDPANAPLAIFGPILAPLALAEIAKIAQAANIRRGKDDADVAKLGGKISGRLGTIRKVTGFVTRPSLGMRTPRDSSRYVLLGNANNPWIVWELSLSQVLVAEDLGVS